MQTKGGGKHDILPVGRVTATTRECDDAPRSRCGHVPPHGAALVSTEECAWRIRAVFHHVIIITISLWRRASRAIVALCMIKQWRSA